MSIPCTRSEEQELLKRPKEKSNLTEAEKGLEVVRGGRWRWAKWAKKVKRYKFPGIKYVSHGDVIIHSGVTAVHDTGWQVWKFLRDQTLKVLITRERIVRASCRMLTYRGDHVATRTNTESLCCHLGLIPRHGNHISWKKRWKMRSSDTALGIVRVYKHVGHQ